MSARNASQRGRSQSFWSPCIAYSMPEYYIQYEDLLEFLMSLSIEILSLKVYDDKTYRTTLMNAKMKNEKNIGSRIRDLESYCATVRYIGPVAAAKNKAEVWLGVEWDDHSRGKHDGCCIDEEGNLHRYFLCPSNAGSFIKPSKVTQRKVFMDAIRERYVSIDDPQLVAPNDIIPDAYVTTTKGHQKPIEFVGEKKIRKWQQLSEITKLSMRADSISRVGTLEGLSHITEIDLQDNLLWQWEEVFKFGTQLRHLEGLLLHSNKLQDLTEDIVKLLPHNSFPVLQVLALNSCGIKSWATIQSLEPFLPVLSELYLADNVMSDLFRSQAEAAYAECSGSHLGTNIGNRAQVSGFKSLKILDISRCSLDEWSQAMSFAKLPRLEQLLLDDNAIETISQCPADANNIFPSLFRLSLSSTMLKCWSDVDALASYKNLRNLRLSHVPLFNGRGLSEVRPVVIARIQQLQVFNASIVTLRERTDSEKFYLRQIIRQMCDVGKLPIDDAIRVMTHPLPSSTVEEGDDQISSLLGALKLQDSELKASLVNVLRSHPRAIELKALYRGELHVISTVNDGSGSLASLLINVTINNMTTRGPTEPIVMKLPSSLTVTALRSIVKQKVGLDPRNQLLSLRLSKESIPTLLNDDASTLAYFGVIDGSDIFINEDKTI